MQKDADLFTRGALNTIVARAGGIPRIINILCDNCLITTFGNQQKQVTAKVAKEIIGDLQIQPQAPRWRLALASPIILVALAVGLYAGKKAPVLPAGAGTPADLQSAAAPGATKLTTQPVSTETAAKQPEHSPAVEASRDAASAIGGAAAKRAPVEPKERSGPPPVTEPVTEPVAQPVTEAETERSGTYRIARRGDTLAKLTLERYGLVNGSLLRLVKQHNPFIDDINVIQEGRKIFFPEMDR